MVSGEAYTNDMKQWEYERGERKKEISNGKKVKGTRQVDKGQGSRSSPGVPRVVVDV
jgi:hypothetical protein